MDFSALAVGVGVGVLTIVIIVIILYTFKDKVVENTSLNLSDSAKGEITTFWTWVTIAIVFFGLLLFVSIASVMIQVLRGGMN